MQVAVRNHRLVIGGMPAHYVRTKNKGGIITPRFIVLHDTASPLTPEGDIDWLARSSPNSSAHFIVARNAKVTQLAPTNVKTWHAGQSKWKGVSPLNSHSIGIEIDNPGALSRLREGVYAGGATRIMGELASEVEHRATPAHGDHFWLRYTREQIEMVVAMCRSIVRAYAIEEIVTHWLISPGRKIDTNPLFPLEQVRELVFGNRDPEEGKPKPAPLVADATVTASNLNLRGTPGGEILAVLPAGTRLDVQEGDRLSGWLRVIVGIGPAGKDEVAHYSKTGFVSERFVRFD